MNILPSNQPNIAHLQTNEFTLRFGFDKTNSYSRKSDLFC